MLGTSALTAVSILAIVSAVLTLRAQSAAQQAPAASAPRRRALDVTSVKPAQQDASGRMRIGIMPQPGGRFVASNVTLAMLLQIAYELKGPKQAEGAPDWAASDRFDIEAKAAGVSGTLSRDQMAPYLQALLADRFKLTAHRETRQRPVYALVLAKRGRVGPQLMPHTNDSGCIDPTDPTTARRAPAPSTPGGSPPLPSPCGGFSAMIGPDGMRLFGNKVSMDMLAAELSGGPFGNAIDRVVIDRTGLSSTYDLSLSFSPSGLPPGPKGLDLAGPQAGVNAGPGPVSSDSDSQVLLPTALQEQLGLKLEPQAGPVDVLVIDHVERPSQN